MMLYDILNVKKLFCSSVRDLVDNSCIQKMRNQLRNFKNDGQAQVPHHIRATSRGKREMLLARI